jgi:Cu2+-exporting ATPase
MSTSSIIVVANALRLNRLTLDENALASGLAANASTRPADGARIAA